MMNYKNVDTVSPNKEGKKVKYNRDKESSDIKVGLKLCSNEYNHDNDDMLREAYKNKGGKTTIVNNSKQERQRLTSEEFDRLLTCELAIARLNKTENTLLNSKLYTGSIDESNRDYGI